jgi:TonB family protein
MAKNVQKSIGTFFPRAGVTGSSTPYTGRRSLASHKVRQRVKPKVLPLPTSLDTRTSPPSLVTIRFTIHRDGTITDVTILQSSGVPPYDFAAKKGIELSSPLNPLPKNFPNDSERVTAMFYYNSEPPKR